MAANSATVKASVDQQIKDTAEQTLQSLGLDMASGIRLFIYQVALKGRLPFEVSLPSPSKATLAAIADAYAGRVEAADGVEALFAGLDD